MSLLLTGATGFVGAEVLARLLRDGDDDVLAVVRGPGPAARLREALARAGVPERDRGRVGLLVADVTSPLPSVPGVSAVVHCAASVSFGLGLEEARRINVAGTRHALAAAERAGARYVHVSTAYVAGRHRGRFGEDDLDRGQAFRNTYERSKWEAERLVRRARPDAAVLRPSIVVGEAATGWTSSFNVVYRPLRAFARGLLGAVPARAGGRVDIVPVDFVAEAITHVTLERPDVRGTLHLVAGENAVTVDELLDLASDAFGLERPALVPGDDALGDRGDAAAQYLPYFDMDVVFGDERARSVLGPAGIAAPPLHGYFDALVAYAQAARWGKARVARPAAFAVRGAPPPG